MSSELSRHGVMTTCGMTPAHSASPIELNSIYSRERGDSFCALIEKCKD